MRIITKHMSVKETREWIAERKKNFNKLTWEEVNDFNREMQLIKEEWSAKPSVKVARFIKSIFIWVGVAIVLVISVLNRIYGD